jgi:hypothetical protein
LGGRPWVDFGLIFGEKIFAHQLPVGHQTWKYVEIEILQFFIIDVFPIKTPHL